MTCDLNKLYSTKRTGIQSTTSNGDPRSEFQRDFDRLIFSSPFRRLQNKTQVFPLPGSVFVHNRLTHSLEVSSVARSLGTLIGDFVVKNHSADLSETAQHFYTHDLSNVVASASLCHDIGNPAFGHSGEDAIAGFFVQNESHLKSSFSDKEWNDFIHFEGNANAIRVLTQQQTGMSEGGLQLSYSTLSSIAKYPCEASAIDKKILHRKKFGFFQAHEETFSAIADEVQMVREPGEHTIYRRHPFVWLVEAADDICYNIIDIEDAHRLGIIAHRDCYDVLYKLILDLQISNKDRMDAQLAKMSNKNNIISYLRSKAISSLTTCVQEIYEKRFEEILDGSMDQALFDQVLKQTDALQEIITFSINNIYNNRNVVEIENAGYHVIYELLQHFVPSILKDKSTLRKSDKKALRLIPNQFVYEGATPYHQTLGVIDYISGMTDNYATDLYKRIKGIEVGMHI